jgi:uncharacterized protein involved in outer membrane biogenesis
MAASPDGFVLPSIQRRDTLPVPLHGGSMPTAARTERSRKDVGFRPGTKLSRLPLLIKHKNAWTAMRIAKIAGLTIGGLLLLPIALGGVLLLGGDRLTKWLVEGPVSSSIGRQISIKGPVHIHWGNPVVLTVEDVSLANTGWGTRPDMFKARRLEVALAPRSLLRFDPVFPRVVLDRPEVFLETNAEGTGNWVFGVANTSGPSRRRLPTLLDFEIHDGTFGYRNGLTGAEADIDLAALSVSTPDAVSPVAIKGEGQFNTQSVAFQGSVGPLRELQTSTAPYPIAVEVTTGTGKASVKGAITEPVRLVGVDLTVQAEGKDLQPFAALLGFTFPATPDYRMSGHVGHNDDGIWRVDPFQVQLGRSDVKGKLAADTRPRKVHVTGDLTSDTLDVDDLVRLYSARREEQRTQGQAPPDDGRVIPNTPISFKALGAIDADLRFSGRHVKALRLPIDEITMAMVLKDGLLELRPLKAAIANGSIEATLAINSAKDPPNGRVDVDFRRIDLQRLVRSLGVTETAAGTLGGVIRLGGAGHTVREFAAGLDGEVSMFMEGGRFSQLIVQAAMLHLAETVGLAATGDSPVPINCLVGQFDVKKGRVTVKTLVFDTDATVIEGAGWVDLGSEDIHIDLTPHSKNVSPISLRTPLHLRGTFANRTGYPEPTGLAARAGAAIALGVVLTPLAALLPMIDIGLGEKNRCDQALAAAKLPAKAIENAR